MKIQYQYVNLILLKQTMRKNSSTDFSIDSRNRLILKDNLDTVQKEQFVSAGQFDRTRRKLPGKPVIEKRSAS